MNNNNQDLQFLALILKLDNRVKVYSNPKVKGKFIRINQADQNSQFDLDSSMMAEFEADFLVLVFQVAELVEKLGLDFVQPFVDLVLTEVDTFDLDLTVLTEYSLVM
jgi:hypothetical protein